MNITYESENKAIALLLEVLDCLEAAGYDCWMLDPEMMVDKTLHIEGEEFDAREWAICFHQWPDCDEPTQVEIELVTTMLDDLLNLGRE